MKIKININFDMIDKIYQTKGEGKLQRNAKIATKVIMPFALGSTIGGIFNVATGRAELAQTILNIGLTNLSLYLATLAVTPVYTKLLTRLFAKTPEEAGLEQLFALSVIFISAGVVTSPELLLKTEIYQKEYKLARSGLPGIVRTRGLGIYTYNSFGREEVMDIEEEHKLGTHKYTITIGGPKKEVKQKVLKPAFSN